MKINERRKEHLNKEAFALVDLLTMTDREVQPKQSTSAEGSLSEQDPILTFSNVTEIIERQGNKIKQSKGNKEIAFTEESGEKFQKFVSTIYNDRDIRNLISREFIDSKAWKWLFKTKTEAKAETDFCSYILSEMESSIETVKLYFPIVYLNLKVSFKIGKAEFGYFTSQYFDKYIEEYNKHFPGKENFYVSMKKEYKGQVYAATTVSAEAKKAEEIALAICSFSMDVLKICSNTLDFPFAKIDFDIDRRSNYNPQSEVIVESSNFIEGLSTNLSRPAYPYMLDQFQFEYVKARKLEVFNTFISQLTCDNSELERLVIQGIQRLAKALSNQNYFQRIAELFTILESLLLINEDSPIVDTVSKYSSKLITHDKEKRKLIIKVLKEMYKVRSSWVHHANAKDFEMDDLKRLQQIVHALLCSLINKTKVHKLKQSLLDEIDDAILGAY